MPAPHGESRSRRCIVAVRGAAKGATVGRGAIVSVARGDRAARPARRAHRARRPLPGRSGFVAETTESDARGIGRDDLASVRDDCSRARRTLHLRGRLSRCSWSLPPGGPRSSGGAATHRRSANASRLGSASVAHGWSFRRSSSKTSPKSSHQQEHTPRTRSAVQGVRARSSMQNACK